MCVKIIGIQELEFNPLEPLEYQINGATEILVNYDPLDSKIDCFVGQIERIIENGISCKVDIKVNSNNSLGGIVLERQIEKLKLKLNVNEVVKGLCNFHVTTDRKLSEISEICLGKIDE